MTNTKEILSKLIVRLQSMESEYSVKESNLPEDLTKAHNLLNGLDFKDDDEIINYAVNAIYDAYRNDLDRVYSFG